MASTKFLTPTSWENSWAQTTSLAVITPLKHSSSHVRVIEVETSALFVSAQARAPWLAGVTGTPTGAAGAGGRPRTDLDALIRCEEATFQSVKPVLLGRFMAGMIRLDCLHSTVCAVCTGQQKSCSRLEANYLTRK